MKPGEEFQKRAGHRFNLIIRSMPKLSSEAITAEALLQKIQRLGYLESLDQLKIDLSALKKRGEVSAAAEDGDAYYVLPKGIFETRKRTALIRIHNLEICEADLDLLEAISRRGKPLE